MGGLLIDTNSPVVRYGILIRFKYFILLGSFLLLVGLGFVSIRLGAAGLSFSEIFSLLLKPDDSWSSTIVWMVRLPRFLAALLSGAALALSGTVMQCMLRNPLASPYTLGLSNAAAFGAAVGIVVFDGGRLVGATQVQSLVSNPLLVTITAFLCAIMATGLLLALVRIGGTRTETIVLAGLAINSLFGTLLALLTYLADDVAIASIVYWQFGSLAKADWTSVAILAIVLFLAFITFFFLRWDFNAIEAGEDLASSLGVRPSVLRILSLALAALLTSTVVAFFGIIGFIGLIGPHLVRRIFGNDYRFALPAAMVFGALILIIANILGSHATKTVFPVGIVTSALGGPLFLGILIRRNGL